MTSTATYPTISNWLNNHRDELIQKSCYIFEHPETAYKEKLSSKCLADYLETQGFQIEWNTAGIETAFTAAWTNSDIDITKIQPAGKNVSSSNEVPIIGFLAEYDALPEIGHACGHNLLGTAVCAAACALKADYESSGEPIVIRVYGCPAEEIMSGKIIMDEQNVFDDLSIAVTGIHSTATESAMTSGRRRTLKNYTFHGVSAHASAHRRKRPQRLRCCRAYEYWRELSPRTCNR